MATFQWEPGAVVDGFTVRAKLGQGGMGAVFLVEQAATGGRFAAKALSAAANPELLLRFQREAEAQARVDGHPNVVRIHSTGSAQGQSYIVMDLASGGDLAQRIADGGLPPRQAAKIVRDLSLGLAHVHRHGILHRDLKPENVLFDERGTPKLVDFGLAKVVGADTLTQTGDLLGTPAYMAPEQARGIHEDVDARCDVYGLGGILYAALTGKPPFEGHAVLELLVKVSQDRPIPPSEHARVPPRLEAIVLRCLEKRPQDRFPSADALAEALTAWLDGERRAPSRAPLLGALALLGLSAAAVLALTLGPWAATPEPEPRSVAETAADPSPAEPPGTAPVASVTRPQISPTRRFAAILDAIGAPSQEPPRDLPKPLWTGWRMTRRHPYTAVGYGQNLKLKRHVRYARQWFLYAARKAKNPHGWAELGATYDVPGGGEANDREFAARCYELAAKQGNTLGASRRGEMHYWRAYKTPGAYARAASWYRRGLQLKEDNIGSRTRCAERLAAIALVRPKVVSLDEGIAALDKTMWYRDQLSTAGRKHLLASLLIRADRTKRSEQVARLLREVANSPHIISEEAAAELAVLLRKGWGEIPQDRAEGVRVLRAQLPEIRKRGKPHPYHWGGAVRVLYELGCALTVYSGGEVARNDREAAALWRESNRMNPHKGWWYWCSLRRLIDLHSSGSDAVSEAESEQALQELRAAKLSGNGTATWLLDRGFKDEK